jgi:mono/diheme cytochrome c family protein
MSTARDDYGVPHCHGGYGDYAGSFRLEDGERIAGEMPPKQKRKIKEFISANREDLMEAWHDLSK